MSDKFQNKYRIPSSRLQNWNYGSNAMYFVTICTKNRECYFGEIIHTVKTQGIASMRLSEIGKMVETEWLKTVELRQDMNLQMGEFVVMPNHFHALIAIGENRYNIKFHNNGNNCVRDCRDTMRRVSTDTTTNYKNKFGPQSKNLASIIRGFKSAVTINARKIHADFSWQSLYYDHIIRNDESFQRISNYIVNNPLKWTGDKFYNP
jgi:putative transposase